MPTPQSIERARRLRRDQTGVERLLWSKLRNRQIEGSKWRRQFPVGPYIADFACVEARLIVELDGGQHAEDRAKYDARRTAFLESEGFRVVRFWNADVIDNIGGVIEAIRLHVRS